MNTATPAKVYRRSELETIADGCLLRYRALWIDGVDDSSDISLIGVSFARIKHEYILRLVDRNLSQDAEEARAAFVEGIAITQLPARLIPELRDLWEFHAVRFILLVDRFVTSEETGTVGEVSFSPDCVLAHPEDNALEIIDDKSGHTPPPTELQLKENFQARVYSRYARDRWPGFEKYQFTLNAVRFNKQVTVSFNQAELDTVDIEIQAAIATIELAKAANAWPAIPGPACRFCTLRCSVVDTPMSLPKRLTPEQASKLAPWLLVAEKQLRSLKASLKEHVKEHGPVEVGGGVEWALRPSVSRSYALADVVKAMKQLKIPLDIGEVAESLGLPDIPLVTLSAASLKKLQREYPELEPMLEAREKTSYRFSAKKPGDDDEED
jgi:PD-(D/E)XK nuclease superfamily